MKTDDLISMLADDATPEPINFFPLFLVGTTCSMLIMLMAIGVREDFWHYIQQPMVMLKHILPWFIIIALLPFVRASLRPEYTHRLAPKLLPYIIIAFSALLFGLFNTDKSGWGMAVIGKTSPYACIGYILLLSIPLFWGVFFTLSKGAPSFPTRAGIAAGLVSGAVAASIYAFSCDQDHPLFFAIWYSAAILISGIIGAFIGHFRLRW